MTVMLIFYTSQLLGWGVTAVPVTFAVVLVFCLTVVTTDYIDGWRKRRAFGDIPIVDEGSNMSVRLRWNKPEFVAEREYAKAYKQYSKTGKPYVTRVQSNDYGIVLPLNSAKEWRALPHDQLSFGHGLAKMADMCMHLNVTDRTPVQALHLCNNARSLGRFNDLVASATDRVLPLTFGPATEQKFKELNVYKVILSLCSAVAMSILLGPDFCMDAPLIQTTQMYHDSIMPSCYERTGYPQILRPFVWRFSPICRALRSRLSALKMKLIPEVKHRIELVRLGRGGVERDSTQSLLDALIETAFEKGSLSRSEQSTDDGAQVGLIVEQVIMFHFELCQPISFFLCSMLYVVMDHKEYVVPLREEASQTLRTSGGHWSLDCLKNAPKLESFARETFRLYDISALTSFRRVMKPVHLKSISMFLKPGTLVLSPCRDVHLDPDHYDNPTIFDGYRFYDAIRESCNPHMTTTSLTFLSFSHGSTACPARVIASQMSRTLFMKILLKYDMELTHEKMPAYGFTHGPVYVPNLSIMMRVKPRSNDA
uniref:p450 n=1 Tax=Petromyces alliaceus TaxID=209559 RepID=A0A0N9HII7_PETAA|nr:P450 [Aspergillus alliaceus]